MPSINGSKTLISLEQVSKFFNSSKNTGVAEITLEVKSGEIVAIVGPSGCGKTTLLRLIAKLIEPTSGMVRVSGDKIGFVSQSPSLLPNRNVEKNISLPLEVFGCVDNGKVEELLELMHLQNSPKLYPYQLSGGMQQRVCIARAISYDPVVVLMDEPFASLDEIIRERLNLQLVTLQQRLGQTIVFVTHNVEEAVFIADRIVVMSKLPGSISSVIPIRFSQERSDGLRSSLEYFEAVKKVKLELQETYV